MFDTTSLLSTNRLTLVETVVSIECFRAVIIGIIIIIIGIIIIIIIIPSPPTSSKWSLVLGFPVKIVYALLLSPPCYLIPFHHPQNRIGIRFEPFRSPCT